MAVRADWQVRPSAGAHRCRYPDMSDVEGALRLVAPADDGDGGEPARSCGAGLAAVGF